MIRKPQPSRKPTKREPAAITSARLTGRYLIAATIVGAVLTAIMTAAVTNGFGLLVAEHPGGVPPTGQQSARPASPRAALLPTATASGSGLDVQTSTFFLVGVDTAFVTKNTFEPNGQIAAALVNAESPVYLSIFRNAGAINEQSTALRLVFSGESTQGVRILDITPVILKRAPPWHGDLFGFYPQGTEPTVQTSLDLDDTFPAVTDSATGRPYFEEKTIILRQGEQEVVIMRVTASRGYVAYELKVEYLVGTQERSVTLTDRGRPFELSAVNCPLKNVMSYGHVFYGPVAKVAEVFPDPSHIATTCSPN